MSKSDQLFEKVTKEVLAELKGGFGELNQRDLEIVGSIDTFLIPIFLWALIDDSEVPEPFISKLLEKEYIVKDFIEKYGQELQDSMVDVFLKYLSSLE